MSKKLDDLFPSVCIAATRAISELNTTGIPTAVTYTRRTEIEQRALFAQGRETLDVANALRKEAGLYLLAEKENKHTVTNCDGVIKRSPHQGGRAIDIVPLQNGRAIWPVLADPRWVQISAIMKKHGFTWGGDWKDFPDYPHYQM